MISDAVNLGSRLESLTKLYGVSILISEKTLLNLEEAYKYNDRFLDRVNVKGKKESVGLFEIFDGDTEEQKGLKKQTQSKFEEAIFLYFQEKFAAAKQIMSEILQINPEDKVAQFYLQRSDKFQNNGRIKD